MKRAAVELDLLPSYTGSSHAHGCSSTSRTRRRFTGDRRPEALVVGVAHALRALRDVLPGLS